MVDSGNETHGVDEGLPGIALAGQHPAAFSRQTVEAATTVPGPLDPPPLQPAAFFQPIEERVQRCDVELQLPCRARLDELADLVSMTGARFDDREDDQFRRPLLQFAV